MKSYCQRILQFRFNPFQTNHHKLTHMVRFAGVLLGAVMVSSLAVGQDESAFAVKNEKNKDWPAAEANRIYASACMLVAREVRPEHPPELRPQFTLVLGAEKDQLVERNHKIELRLKEWNREKFAHGVVLLAAREVLQNKAVMMLTQRTLSWTDAVVPAAELADAR
jgi:hypothetical protein